MTVTDVVPATLIDQEAILRSLNLRPNDPNVQALLLISERYGLDPLMKHLVLIQGRPYVTRDGYLAVAHRSGQLDGIEVLEEGEDDDAWWARVAVYRKDMSHPFTYKGRYPMTGGNKQYGPEMAIKCAEVAALRRAFNVTGVGAADEKWDTDDVHATATAAAPQRLSETSGRDSGTRTAAVRSGRLNDDEREALAVWLVKLEALEQDSETRAELVRELKPILAGRPLAEATGIQARRALAKLEEHRAEIDATLSLSDEEPWPLEADPANPEQRPFTEDPVPEEADPNAGDEAG